jgi:hypothetical protein
VVRRVAQRPQRSPPQQTSVDRYPAPALHASWMQDGSLGGLAAVSLSRRSQHLIFLNGSGRIPRHERRVGASEVPLGPGGARRSLGRTRVAPVEGVRPFSRPASPALERRLSWSSAAAPPRPACSPPRTRCLRRSMRHDRQYKQRQRPVQPETKPRGASEDAASGQAGSNALGLYSGFGCARAYGLPQLVHSLRLRPTPRHRLRRARCRCLDQGLGRQRVQKPCKFE